jgi:F0F1-type ATP synthase assembly protein I
MKTQSPQRNNNRELLRYAGLGTQIMAAIALAVFAGIRMDKWLHTFPLLACVLPLLVLSALFYKVFRDTGGRK